MVDLIEAVLEIVGSAREEALKDIKDPKKAEMGIDQVLFCGYIGDCGDPAPRFRIFHYSRPQTGLETGRELSAAGAKAFSWRRRWPSISEVG